MREHGGCGDYEAPALQELGTVEDYTHQAGVSVVLGVVVRGEGSTGGDIGGIGELPVTGAAVPMGTAAAAVAAAIAAARASRRSGGSSTPRS